MRKIIHIDMDAFYASVEQRDNPELHRGVVAAASYEARQYGVRSAMSSYQAVKRCPQLILLPPRFDVYKSVSRQIHRIFAEVTDLIEPLSLDEAYLDVTHNKLGNASATLLAKEIKRRIREETGLTASAGVSYNKFLAKIASDYQKPDGLFVITPAMAETFIEQLPIGQFYGIGPKTASKLQALGIQTGRDLKNLPFAQMKAIFGKSADFYYHLVRGQDDRPVETNWVRKSVGSETTFPQDLHDIREMMAALAPLAQEVLEWMEKHQTYGRTITLKVKYADFQQHTRSRTMAHPFDNLPMILYWLERLLENTEAGKRPIRLLGLSMSNLTKNKPDTTKTASMEALEPSCEQLQLPLFDENLPIPKQ
jgi:DNA polymerase-4